MRKRAVSVPSVKEFLPIHAWLIEGRKKLGLSMSQVLVFALIGHYSFEQYKGLLGGNKYIENRLKLSSETVSKALKTLKESSLIYGDPKYKKGNSKSSNTYYVHRLRLNELLLDMMMVKNSKGFIPLYTWLIGEGSIVKLNLTEALVYGLIWSFAKSQKGTYFGGNKYIAKRLGLSDRQISTIIKRLVELKLIKISTVKHPSSKGNEVTYTIVAEKAKLAMDAFKAYWQNLTYKAEEKRETEEQAQQQKSIDIHHLPSWIQLSKDRLSKNLLHKIIVRTGISYALNN